MKLNVFLMLINQTKMNVLLVSIFRWKWQYISAFSTVSKKQEQAECIITVDHRFCFPATSRLTSELTRMHKR
jgi:hypothetical protein